MVLGGEDYLIAPLSLGSLEQFQGALETLAATSPSAGASVVIDAAWHSLKRNYPHMERATVAELVDLENMGAITRAVMDVSGAWRKELESTTGEPRAKAE